LNNNENRFTPAREFCPHPEYWHSADSESTEDEVSLLVAAFVRALQPEFVLETGTAYGITAWNIGLALYDNGHGKLVSLDSDKSRIKDAKEYIAHKSWATFNHPWAVPVEVLHQNSMEYTPPQNIDFAFFDSWQQGRGEEFRRFYNLGLLKGGTIVAFHDTAPHHAVLPYIQELERDKLIKAIYLRTPRGIALAQVL